MPIDSLKKPDDPQPNYLIVGKIGAPFGIRGWVKVQSFTEFGEHILNYQPWYLVSVHAALMITEPSGCEAGLDKHLQEKAQHTQTYVSSFPANVCPKMPTDGRTRTKSERSQYLVETHTTILIEQGRIHGKTLIVKIQGIETPESARLFTGKFIAITRNQLPPLAPKEYYWSDLIGLKVINQHGEDLGTVIYLMETGANDVLVVKGLKEQAIPYLPHVILNIDLVNKEIHVNWELI